MTGREALDKLELQVMDGLPYSVIQRNIQIIGQDLAILEILKKYIWIEQGKGKLKEIQIIHIDIGNQSHENDFKKIERWMENDGIGSIESVKNEKSKWG